MLVLSAAPSAAIVLNLAELHRCEQENCASTLLMSSILCAVTIPLMTKLGNASAGIVLLCVAVPSLIAAFAVLAAKTHDTGGVDLTAVKGDEWDEPTDGMETKNE